MERLKAPVNICDSTLCMGEQSAGTVFSNIERYRIAQLLDSAGIPQIVVGAPMYGEEEKTAVKHVARMGLEASVMSYNRADLGDINASIECDVDSVCIGLPASEALITNELVKDHEWVLNKIYESVSYAKDHGFYISCMAEDAARADLGFIIDFAKEAKRAGADRFAYVDSLGVEDPFTCSERIEMIRKIANIEVEIVARNDYGMATANTLAAIRSGATFATVTSLGIGQRAGCAALEEVVMATRHMMSLDTEVDTAKLRSVAEAVSKATGVPIHPCKPFLGAGCFRQETLIGDSVMNDPYDPKEMGLKKEAVMGKHSTMGAVSAYMSGLGVQLSDEEAQNLLSMVRKAVNQMHRSLDEADMFLLYNDMMKGADVFDEAVPEDPIFE